MIRRIIESLVARADPLAAKQKLAIYLQDKYGVWSALFFDQLTPEQVREAAQHPRLAEAERIFREIISEGEDTISPGAMVTTKHQLALLLHRQGRLDEAASLYRDVVASCRLYVEPTETCDWALCFALYRLAELTMPIDRAEATAMFAESKEIAHRRRYRDGMQMADDAVQHFHLNG